MHTVTPVLYCLCLSVWLTSIEATCKVVPHTFLASQKYILETYWPWWPMWSTVMTSILVLYFSFLFFSSFFFFFFLPGWPQTQRPICLTPECWESRHVHHRRAFFFFFDKISHCRWGWPWICWSFPSSASPVLGLLVRGTLNGQALFILKFLQISPPKAMSALPPPHCVLCFH